MVKCCRCGVKIEESFETCPNCGYDLNSVEDKPLIETTKDGACSHCGVKIIGDSDFCPNCGNRLNALQTLKCSQCGSQINENDLICSTCGSKINNQKAGSNCGNPLDEAEEFCDECGQKVSSVKKDLVSVPEKNSDNIVDGILSVLIPIIVFFKGLFGGNK